MRGQGDTANGCTINDVNVEEDINMGTAVAPNFDSIRERCVLASDFDAQYGNSSGGLAVVVSDPATTGCTARGLNSFALQIPMHAISFRRAGRNLARTSSGA